MFFKKTCDFNTQHQTIWLQIFTVLLLHQTNYAKLRFVDLMTSENLYKSLFEIQAAKLALLPECHITTRKF